MYYHAALLILCGNHLKNGIDLCTSSDLHLIRNSTLLSIQITINRDIRPEIANRILDFIIDSIQQNSAEKKSIETTFSLNT